MADEGLVRQRVRYYVLCDRPDDPDRNVHRRCLGHVYGEPDGSFPAAEYYCDGKLEHRVFPGGKPRFREIVTEPNDDGIDCWLQGLARLRGLAPVRREAGLFDVARNGAVVSVCYVNRCVNPTKLALSLTFDDPIVYVYNVVPALPPGWLSVAVTIDVASLYADADLLESKVEEAAAKPRQRSLRMRCSPLTASAGACRATLRSSASAAHSCNCSPSGSTSVQKYAALLHQHQHDVHGTYHATVGGGGQPDGYCWSKYDYLQAILEGHMSFGGSRRNAASWSQPSAIATGSNSTVTRRDQPGVLFASTNAVSDIVWDNLLEVNRQSGWRRFVIIPRDLLIEMIVQCDAEHLYNEDYSA